MLLFSRQEQFLILLCFAVLVGCGAVWVADWFLRGRKANDRFLNDAPFAAEPDRRRVVVHVAGEVKHPGVYKLQPGTRVHEAIQAAGGPTAEADLDALNLAAVISDGEKVLVDNVKARRFAAPPRVPSSRSRSSAGPGKPPPDFLRHHRININTADAAALQQLRGIGPATAARILAYRRQHGPFTEPDDLLKVPGIGPKKLAAWRPFITT